MRRTLLALPLAALMVVAWLTPQASAQDTKTARGSVTAMAGDSITVKAGASEMKFGVDAKTMVTAAGGSTASRAAAAAGKPGPKLAELIKVGDSVEVHYHDMKGTLHAAEIRKVASPGSGGGGVASSEPKTETSMGTVDTVTASSLTISGSRSGGATFKQSFTIDGNTKVIGVGAGTAAAAKGGKMAITDYVGMGDRVTVTYRPMGNSLHAAEVHVTMKSTTKPK